MYLNLKLYKTITFLFAAIIAGTPLMAQQKGIITGRIFSETGQPLEFVNVGIRQHSLGTVTNEDGTYILGNVPLGDHSLTASIIGFGAEKSPVLISVNQLRLTVDFALEESAKSLGEVVISGTMKEVSKLDSPVPVEVYSHKFFRANPTPSVFEALQNVNGGPVSDQL